MTMLSGATKVLLVLSGATYALGVVPIFFVLFAAFAVTLLLGVRAAQSEDRRREARVARRIVRAHRERKAQEVASILS